MELLLRPHLPLASAVARAWRLPAVAVLTFVVWFLLGSAVPASAEGTFIVYECGANLCRVDSDGSNAVALTGSDGMYASPSLSSDGLLLAFVFDSRAYVVSHGDPAARGDPVAESVASVALHPFGIALAGIESGSSLAFIRDLATLERFVSPTPVTTLAWAGDLLVVNGPPTPSGKQTLCLWENPACVRMLAEDDQRDLTDPAVSPDGGRLAVAACALPERQACSLALYAVNTGRKLGDLTFGGADTEPAWSPDGQSLVFSRAGDLYVIGADGGAERLLVSGGRRATWGGQSEAVLAPPPSDEMPAPPAQPGPPVPAPAPAPPPAQPDTPAVRAALVAAAMHLRWPAEQLVVVRVEPREWRDASLGCPQPGVAYAQVITPGYLVTITTPNGAAQVQVHTDANQRTVIC